MKAAQASIVVRGAGSIGMRHARVFSSLGAKVTLWPVRSGRQLSPEQRERGIVLMDEARAHECLIASDLVVVATDTHRHVSDAVDALDAGAQRILVEKPVATSASEALPLVNHPRAGAVWVAAPLRAHEGFMRLRELLPGLGQHVSAHVWCQSWLPDWRPERDYRDSYSARADEGGVLRDLVHELDYVSALFGQLEHRGSVLDLTGPLEIEADQAATLLFLAGRTVVTMRLDYTTRPSARGIDVRGPMGSISWSLSAATLTVTDTVGVQQVERLDVDKDRDTIMRRQAEACLNLSPGAHPQIRLTTGAAAPLTEAIAAIQLCDEARRVARSVSRGGLA